MPSPSKTWLTAYVDRNVAARFRARTRDGGGASAALRRFIHSELGEPSPASPAAARQVQVRLDEETQPELLRVAREAGMTPAGYLRALARVHLTGKPVWSAAEAEAIRDLVREVRAIGNNVNQIAFRLNLAASASEYPSQQGQAARDAVAEVGALLARLSELSRGFQSAPIAERRLDYRTREAQ